jgi:hypothetical protein
VVPDFRLVRLSVRVPVCRPKFGSTKGWVLALALDWLSSRVNNVKGGRRNTSTRTVEPGAPAGG